MDGIESKEAWEVIGPYPGNHTNNHHRLFDFNGKGEYRTPAFTWFQPPPGLTGIKVLELR